MDQVYIKNLGNDVTVKADVLERSDKRLVVVIEKTQIRLILARVDVRQKYVGRVGRLEFESDGQLVKRS